MARSLYICYFGVREPLVQTQVIPYLRELVKGGHEITLLTFEPVESAKGEKRESGKGEKEIRKELREQGIDWYWLRYHKRFSVAATAWDIFRGAVFIRRFIARERPDILHARVHVPMLMAALARKFSRRKPKLLFDIRGFMPEEYTDAGIWPEGGWLYLTAKRVEKWLMKEADGFVVLTEKARSILFPESRETGFDKDGRPVEVIPCCVDLSRFEVVNSEHRHAIREKLGVTDRNVIVYVGSFGGWYLTDEMISFFSAAREYDPRSFILIMTQRMKESVESKLISGGFEPNDFMVTSVVPGEVASYLASADISVSFIKSCYSKQSSSPTKIAEYLACGLPIIANRGVGDIDSIIENNSVGVILDSFDVTNYLAALESVDQLVDVSERARETAFDKFDLSSVGGNRYRRLYARILQPRQTGVREDE